MIRLVMLALSAGLALSACVSKDRTPAHHEEYPVTDMLDPVTKRPPAPRVQP